MDSPQYKRLDFLSQKTNMPITQVYDMYVLGSNYTHWVRDMIFALATENIQ